MTRENIKYEAKDYAYKNYTDDLVDVSIKSFIAGAQWADSNPKSSWISVEDDLPCNHKELMTIDDKGRPETKRVLVRIQETDTSFQRPYYADCKMSKWDSEEDKFLWHLCSQGYITHWMPIPELPEE